MKTLLPQSIQDMPLYYPVKNWLERRRHAREMVAWDEIRRPAPPPHLVKQEAIRYYARRHGLRIFVETGTYLGEMIQAMRHEFDEIFSIELSQPLYKRARRRFATATNVHLIQGDSGVELARLMPELSGPALFWLDGHYSEGITAKGDKDTPVVEELTHILSAATRGHMILIDDARCFGSDPSYPTVAQIRQAVASRGVAAKIVVQDDSIRIGPV